MKLKKPISVAVAVLAAGGVAAGSAAYADNGGNVITVNAQTDPAQAHALMQVFDQIHGQSPKDTSFTPTDNPTLGVSGWSDASSGNYIGDCGGGTSTKTLSISHGSGFSWSVGGSVSASFGVGIPDVASLKFTLKFGVDHQWQNTETDSRSVTATAGDGKMVWVVTAQRQATVTGSYKFTTPGGDYQVHDESGKQVTKHVDAGTYSIQNVVLNLLAAVKGSDDPTSGIIYAVEEAPLNCAAATKKGAAAAQNGVHHDPALVDRLTSQLPPPSGM